MENNNFNPTCAISGKKENLQMFAFRDNCGNMIGWIFVNQNFSPKDISIDVKYPEKLLNIKKL